MNNIAIIYKSVHHGNTKKLLDGIVKEINNIDIIDADKIYNNDFSKYDVIGFASGIYMSKLHKSIYQFIENKPVLPQKTFIIYTNGSGNKTYGLKFLKYLEELGLKTLGIYQCRGWDTFGLFNIIGGINKEHPNDKDINNCIKFIRNKVLNHI